MSDDLLKKLKRGQWTKDQLCDDLSIERKELNQYLRELNLRGVRVESLEGKFFVPSSIPKGEEPIEWNLEDGWHKFGFSSDYHFNDKAHRLDALELYFDILADEGIKTVLNAGDLDAGNGRIYRGQLNDLTSFGFDNHVDNIVKTLPKKKDLEQLIIGGNHDESFMKSDGVDLVRHVAQRRLDVEYLGMYHAEISITPQVKLDMVHGEGYAYTLGYALQKYLRGQHKGQRPDILGMGHYHSNLFSDYNGTIGMYLGTFQDTNDFVKRKGLTTAGGGWILEFELKNGLMRRIRPEWIRCF